MIKSVESFLSGFPDKVCDQIADGLVDEYLRRDPDAHVNLHVLGSQGMFMIGGEVHSKADFDISEIAKHIYKRIGYQDEVEIFVNIHEVSDSLYKNKKSNLAIVNGYATRETREYLPKPLVYVHDLSRRLDNLRKIDPSLHWIGPDGRIQLIMDGQIMTHITLFIQHLPTVSLLEVQKYFLDHIFSSFFKSSSIKIAINPFGSFVQGGLFLQGGMSGRASHIDFYGGLIPSGSVSLSGRDPQQIERAGAYMARYVAKQLVAQGLVDAVMICLTYTGVLNELPIIEVRPVVGKQNKSKEELTKFVKENYDFRTEAIVEFLHLKQPFYEAASVYGQFGREGFPWEEINML
ncbi:hypothetical protein CO172_03740 [Candidatus Uhrbacteria bacterium CG_4_9_14_3_um_filter_36_7]|uniref:Uncharacterized protein n=1 Tax=Candidatus Uhrbacteria bacterium CG_4_9_14_3_um_filter_36_7 TaxID=1975033 RepID=A0A2M7XER0_9BACT|nr:MAG: hypothetical protein CO172_03740 [Candidatus Uhrbacteria bacterium CG_4_9_14_3_um_filter_36_7]